LPKFYKNECVSLEITRNQLETICQRFLKNIEQILDNLFEDAKKKKKNNSYDKSKIYNFNWRCNKDASNN
jgi:hypothetical protein